MDILNDESDDDFMCDSEEEEENGQEDEVVPKLNTSISDHGDSDIEPEEQPIAEPEESAQKVKLSQDCRRFIWKVGSFPQNHVSDINVNTYEPVKNTMQPIHYFNRYFDDDHFLTTAHFTNLYHLKTTGNELKTDEGEIRRMYGIHLFFGCVKLPRMFMYWSKIMGHEIVSNAMSRNRFFC